MKNIILVSFLLLSSQAFASKFVNIKKLTNSTLNQSAVVISNHENITHVAYKKVLELKANGSTLQEMRQKTVGQALHALCTFFDEGVGLSLNSNDAQGALAATNDILYSTDLKLGDAKFTSILTALTNASKQLEVEIYSGSASGNNTAGEVLGIYDVKNNEIAIFSNTNCGRDD